MSETSSCTVIVDEPLPFLRLGRESNVVNALIFVLAFE
jgi:hypothetical protein